MRASLKRLLMMPVVALLFFGCATVEEHEKIKEGVNMPAPVIEEPQYIFHRVMPGETMATISRWYTGKEGNWRAIADENPSLSPFKLRKGDIVKVPMSLATSHREQPNFSTAPRKKPKKSAKAPAASAPDEEESVPADDQVFGPK